MGDPIGAARHLQQALAPEGTLLLVEPRAGARSRFQSGGHGNRAPLNIILEARS
jgi:hypothetical protein